MTSTRQVEAETSDAFTKAGRPEPKLTEAERINKSTPFNSIVGILQDKLSQISHQRLLLANISNAEAKCWSRWLEAKEAANVLRHQLAWKLFSRSRRTLSSGRNAATKEIDEKTTASTEDGAQNGGNVQLVSEVCKCPNLCFGNALSKNWCACDVICEITVRV